MAGNRQQGSDLRPGTAITRRRFVQYGIGVSSGLLVWRFGGGRAWAQPPAGGVLDPRSIPKYVTPLVIPPAMPRSGKTPGGRRRAVDYYEIAVREFRPADPAGEHGAGADQGLELRLGRTTPIRSTTPPSRSRRRGAGRCASSGSTGWSSRTATSARICCRSTRRCTGPTRPAARRVATTHGDDQTPYRGPVPIVTHLHGGHSSEESDGYPEAWYLPAARNIPAGYARRGSFYGGSRRRPSRSSARPGRPAAPSSSTTTTSAPRRCGTTTTPSG